VGGQGARPPLATNLAAAAATVNAAAMFSRETLCWKLYAMLAPSSGCAPPSPSNGRVYTLLHAMRWLRLALATREILRRCAYSLMVPLEKLAARLSNRGADGRLW
jgi:hypothetical protein